MKTSTMIGAIFGLTCIFFALILPGCCQHTEKQEPQVEITRFKTSEDYFYITLPNNDTRSFYKVEINGHQYFYHARGWSVVLCHDEECPNLKHRM